MKINVINSVDILDNEASQTIYYQGKPYTIRTIKKEAAMDTAIEGFGRAEKLKEEGYEYEMRPTDLPCAIMTKTENIIITDEVLEKYIYDLELLVKRLSLQIKEYKKDEIR